MTFFPSKGKENVRNWPGRALSFRSLETMKRRVFASEACCVMLANLSTSGPPDGEAEAATGLTGACAIPAGMPDLALARGVFAGRLTIRVTVLRHTNAMNPIILASYRLRGAGWSGTAVAF